ncbi:dTMP kinase [Candidatus Woesearchaeota archaeon]|nr:dTMP kinase [Candidatus Woesearchaeota archaeon]
MRRGKLIVLEGLDGSGLSTQARLVGNALRRTGLRVLVTKEPTKGPIGRVIREHLAEKNKNEQKWLQLMFAADRAHHVEREIFPALRKGRTVICDRYVPSSLAYGSLALPLPFLRKLNTGFPKPDVLILLKVPVETALQRIRKSRDSRELYEQRKMLQSVWKSYASLARKEKAVVVDGTMPPRQVTLAILTAVRK